MPHPEPGSPVTDEEFRQLCSNSEGGTNISQVREGRVGRPRKYELARPREQEFSGSARDIYLMAVYYYDKYHNACKNLEAAQRNLQNPTGDKGHLQKLVLKNLHLRASAKNEYLWVRQNKSSPPLSITPEDAWNKARTLREKNEEAQKKFIETEAAHSRGELSAEQMKKTLQRVKHWKDKRSKECEMLELQLKSSGASYGEPQSRPDNADIGGPSNAYQPDPDTTDATNAFTSSHPYVDPGVQMVDYSNMNPPPNGFAANQGAPYYYNQMNPPQPSPNSSLQQNLGYNNATEVQPVLVYFDSNQQLQPAVFDQNCNIDNWNMNGPNVNDTNFLDPRLNDLQAPQAPQAVQSNVVTNGVNNAPLGGNYQSPGINDNFTQDDLNVAQEQVSNTSRFTWNA
ncbi:hypothetical protein diail_5556 [Diaporthe ilicicola]|nr:hypothetical protein diail_5556 [Diaporthe ilicicola]